MPIYADYAHRENINRFRNQLAAATDEKQRATLKILLAEEVAKDKPPQAGLAIGRD